MRRGPWAAVAGLVVVAALGAPGLEGLARGQTCPPAYAACDNGVCCPSADECCPTAADGCCTSYAPFCCGDGTCAVSPSACGAEAGAVICPGYDTPCGNGCAPTGADCCDPQGHYCPAGSACASGTTCTIGDAAPTSAQMVEPVQSASRVLSPLADPGGGSGRSCDLVADRGDREGPAAPLRVVSLVALGALARRRLRGDEAARPSPRADQGRARARRAEGHEVDPPR